MGRELANSIDENKDNNNEKMEYVELGFNFFALGLIFNLIFIIGVAILMSSVSPTK